MAAEMAIRSDLLTIDSHKTRGQFKKLKFLAHSELGAAGVRNAEDVVAIYKLFEQKYFDVSKSASILRKMLEIANFHSDFYQSLPTAATDATISKIEDFKRRITLIKYADEIEEKDLLQKILDKFTSTEIGTNRENIKFPIDAIEGMISQKIIRLDTENGLERIEKELQDIENELQHTEEKLQGNYYHDKIYLKRSIP